jgi:hypothetical protein
MRVVKIPWLLNEDVLCKNCNRTLGWSLDDVDRLIACADYLSARKGGDDKDAVAVK